VLGAHLAEAPWDARAHYQRAHALMHLGRVREAEEAFTKVLACDTGQLTALHGRAAARMMQGRGEEAIADLSRVIEEDPQPAQALLSRAQVMAQRGDEEGALKDLRSRRVGIGSTPR
jgi:Flp pilus assembly protein TadD